jgi:hypothetical protein
MPGLPVFLVLGGLDDAALIGAAILLSTARLSQVAAAVAEIPDFQPVVAEKQMNLGGPGEGGFKVGEKSPETGPAPIHKIPFYPWHGYGRGSLIIKMSPLPTF